MLCQIYKELPSGNFFVKHKNIKHRFFSKINCDETFTGYFWHNVFLANYRVEMKIHFPKPMLFLPMLLTSQYKYLLDRLYLCVCTQLSHFKLHTEYRPFDKDGTCKLAIMKAWSQSYIYCLVVVFTFKFESFGNDLLPYWINKLIIKGLHLLEALLEACFVGSCFVGSFVGSMCLYLIFYGMHFPHFFYFREAPLFVRKMCTVTTITLKFTK